MSFQAVAADDATNGFVRAFVKQWVNAKLGYMASKRLDINIANPRAVKLVEHQNLQEHLRELCVSREMSTELPKCFLGQLRRPVLIEFVAPCSYEFDSRGSE